MFEDFCRKVSQALLKDPMISIKKGDHLLVMQAGARIPATAVSDSHDGSVQIKMKRGMFATVNLSDVELVFMNKPPTSDVKVEELSTDPNDLTHKGKADGTGQR
jgi:hypothetical protein